MRYISLIIRTMIFTFLVFLISSIVTYGMRMSNFLDNIEADLENDDFSAVVGSSSYYYEIDKDTEGEVSYALYTNIVSSSGESDVVYTIVIYGLNTSEYKPKSDTTLSLTCNGLTKDYLSKKTRGQSFTASAFTQQDFTELCGSDTFNLSNITYSLGSKEILSVDKNYTLDYTEEFIIDNGIEGHSEDYISDYFRGVNITIFNVLFFGVSITLLSIYTFRKIKTI